MFNAQYQVVISSSVKANTGTRCVLPACDMVSITFGAAGAHTTHPETSATSESAGKLWRLPTAAVTSGIGGGAAARRRFTGDAIAQQNPVGAITSTS